MKKIIAMTAALAAAASLSFTAYAADTADVYVTIANGSLELAQEKITVTDTDGDGALTINDALYIAHEEKYEGGAAAGYATSETEYGLSLSKLWGVENGSAYGYYLNNASAWSLTDSVKDGDYLNAYAFTDLTGWSDTYTWFDVNTAVTAENAELTLTLSAAGFDEAYNPVTLPVENAVITVNGEKTEFATDADGKVTIALAAGDYVVSAVSDTQTLVPPVCKITVNAETPENDGATEAPVTGNSAGTAVIVCGAALLTAAIAVKGKK